MKFTIPNIGWSAFVSESGAVVELEAKNLDEAAEVIYDLWGSDDEYIEDNLPDCLDATIEQVSTTLNIVSSTISWTDVLDVLDVNEKFGDDGWRDKTNKPEVIAYIKAELAKFAVRKTK